MLSLEAAAGQPPEWDCQVAVSTGAHLAATFARSLNRDNSSGRRRLLTCYVSHVARLARSLELLRGRQMRADRAPATLARKVQEARATSHEEDDQAAE